jgi:hypothetical protein
MKKTTALFLFLLFFLNSFSQKIGEVKKLTLQLKSYSCGDGCYYEFIDMKTQKKYSFATTNQFDNTTKSKWKTAINEIETKCDGEDNCPLVDKTYTTTLVYKSVPQYDWDGEVWKKTKKKENKWVIASCAKSN